MDNSKPIDYVLSREFIETNNVINAFVTYNEGFLDDVNRISKLGLEPLLLGVKDIIYTKGLRTTMGSKLYIDFIPSYDAYVVEKLREYGWVVVGKTNTHEFASGVTTTSSVFGPTRNPLDINRIAGGSSGGSAAAVSAGLVPLTLGTDTAGSVRVPSSLCGVYGYKPTYGLISNHGVFPLAPSLDTVGFLAKDLEWVLRAASIFIKFEELSVRDLRLGIPKWFKIPDDLRSLAPDIVGEVEDIFLNYVSGLGYDYLEVEMPKAIMYVWKYFPIIRYSEATAVHMVNKDRWHMYSPDVRRLLEKGLEYRAVEYLEALSLREEVKEELGRVLKKVDVLITPTTPIPAPKIEDVLGVEDGPIRSLLNYETIYASYIGAPAISIPSLNVRGLPVGVQLICGVGDDVKLLNIASTISQRS